MPKYVSVLLIIACGLIAAMLFLPDFLEEHEAEKAEKAQRGYHEGEVVRVIDGDTLVANIDGIGKKVRLIGIEAPESVNSDKSKNTAEGQQASEYLSSLIKKGQKIFLQRDTSDADSDGRLLYYVWLEEPSDLKSEDEVRAKMLNARLLAEGYAKAVAVDPDVAYAGLFETLAKEAKDKNAGVSSTF